MAAPCFIAWGGATTALTAPLAGVAPSGTANTVKTVLQVGGNTKKIRIIEWGYDFTTLPTGVVTMELIETGTIFATGTAASILAYNDTTGATSQETSTTTTTCFNASAEGTITATRLLAMNVDIAMYFKQQFPLGRELEIGGSNCLRMRMTSTIASLPLVLPYIIWEE
jgi:hypothetical protein